MDNATITYHLEDSNPVVGLDDSQRATRGYVKVTPTGLAANATTQKRSGSITVTDAAGAVSVITINQAASELGLTGPPAFDGTNKFTFTVTAPDVTDLSVAGITIVVKKDGTELTATADYTISGMDIQLTTSPLSGEVYTFTIEANDAAPETVTYAIP